MRAKKKANDVSCPVSGKCGACDCVAEPYAEQLARKDAWVSALFEGLVSPQALHPIIGMERPYCFRNKVVSPFVPGKKGEILTGMYQTGSHRLVDTTGCLVENQTANKVIQAIRSIMLRYKMQGYNEDTNTGFVRHAVVRVGHESGEVLVTLVTNGREFTASKSFCRELRRRCPQVTSVVQNVNTRQTNVILGEEERVLYGPGFILDTLCGLSFRISSQSFYQTNAVQTEVLYETAIGLAGLNGTQTVIDAYCGTGTIGLVAARRGAARVFGVESVEAAVRDARMNARHNGIENAQFICADAAQWMEGLARRAQGDASSKGGFSKASDADNRVVAASRNLRAFGEDAPIDFSRTVLIMDPPRAGSSESFLKAVAACAPLRIVYISCNPLTQVRDCTLLAQEGYDIDSLQPVDMFPHTSHVETVALLSRTTKV